MRLVVIGQAAFGQRVLEGLIDAHHDVALALAPPPAGSREDPMAAAARARGVPLLMPTSYRSADVAAAVHAAAADLGVLAFVTKIVPAGVFDAPRLGSICFHPSLLPRYRGGSALAWQLIQGETRGGFTIFWTDEGIDTGPILLQREIPIDAGDTAGSLYFEKIFEPGIAAMVEAVGLAGGAAAPRQPQDEARASYDPLCGDTPAAIVWRRPAGRVLNLVRGADPQPGAHASWRSQRLRLFGVRREPATDTAVAPGTVLAHAGDRMVVAVGAESDRAVLSFGKARLADGAKASAGEVAAAIGLATGAVLGDGAA